MNFRKSIIRTTIFRAVSTGLGLLIFSAVSFFVAVFVVSGAFVFVYDRPQIFDTVYSPDRKLKAVVFAPPFHPESKNVSVLRASTEPEKHRAGNVFSDSCKWVGVKWLTNQRVVIFRDGDQTKTFKPTNFIAFDRGIDIDFRELKKP
ncbi:MAG TPA: hypothetical protein EYN91_11015 [Candidatus Melainabacteria bacterium]|nr:hypothetical protein [Candidatus Melainabacteria bacterium]HIN65886.1 hypothetical protein [Candidatus Obscuribacterales bacterium]